MEQNIFEKRNSLISSLFQGVSSVNLAPRQLLDSTLYVWQKRYKGLGIRKRVTLQNLKIEDRQISLLALSVSFGVERKSLLEAFKISPSTFAKDIKMISIALLSSRKYQLTYTYLCNSVQYYARWYYQYKH